MQYPRVEEITSQNVITLNSNATLKNAIQQITEKGVRNLVVSDEDIDIYAYIGVNEVVKYAAQNIPVDTPLSKLGLHPLIVIPRRYDVFDASTLFIDDTSLVGVGNDDGSLFGVISHFDVLSIGAKMSEHLMDSPIEVLVLPNSVAYALPNDLLSQHLKYLSESDLDCIIIHESRKPIGIVTKRDITRLLAEDKPIDRPLKDYMNSPLVTFSYKISIKEALASIQEYRYKRIIVTNEDGTLHGLITEKALINLIYSRLAHKTAIGIDRFNQLLEKKLKDKVNENDELKERYELALLASADGVWDWDIENEKLIFSQMWLENFTASESLQKEESSIDDFESIVYEDDRERWAEVRQQSIAKKAYKYEHEYRLIVDTYPVWVKDRAIIIYDEARKPIRIVATTTNMSENIELKSALESYKEMAQRQASYDILTGVANRNYFSKELDLYIENAYQNDKSFVLCYIDIDHFKNVNDTYGHIIGDKVMQELAQRIKALLSKNDLVARFGGDEFAILSSDVEDAISAIDLAEKLVDIMQEPIKIAEYVLHLTLSMGITMYPYDGKEANKLLSNATTALSKAKESGRHTYAFYTDDMSKKVYNYMHMDHEMHQALEKEQFILYYQPQFNAKDNSLSGLEALIRWKNDAGEIISPDEFIPFLEESGLIVPVGKWIIKTAMMQVASWYGKGLNPGILAINVSISQLRDYMFIEDVQKCLTQTGCRPEWIEFEVTESQVMKNPEQIIAMLQELRDIGIKLAIDDFGTGHSSLSYLKRLPIDKLKIDRSFVMDIPEHDEDIAIIKAIIVLANSLGLDVMAEGIEQEDQKNFLIENGCNIHQGFYYNYPMSRELLEKQILE